MQAAPRAFSTASASQPRKACHFGRESVFVVVWSLFKRSIIGSYHKISEKHLDAYLDELEWRFNNRENPYLFHDTVLKLLSSGNIEYNALTAP